MSKWKPGPLSLYKDVRTYIDDDFVFDLADIKAGQLVRFTHQYEVDETYEYNYDGLIGLVISVDDEWKRAKVLWANGNITEVYYDTLSIENEASK